MSPLLKYEALFREDLTMITVTLSFRILDRSVWTKLRTSFSGEKNKTKQFKLNIVDHYCFYGNMLPCKQGTR